MGHQLQPMLALLQLCSPLPMVLQVTLKQVALGLDLELNPLLQYLPLLVILLPLMPPFFSLLPMLLLLSLLFLYWVGPLLSQ